MPLTTPVAFIPGTSPGQAPDASSPPEHLDMESLLTVRGADAFRGAPNFALLIQFIASSMQICEDALQSERQLCWVSTAEGAQLDKMLEDLGDSRNGRTDAQMRRIIPARYAAIFRERSLKLIGDIITLLTAGTAIVGTYQNTGTASYQVTLSTISAALAAEYHSLFVLSKPEGVGYRTLVIEDPDNVFTLDVTGFDGEPMAYHVT